MSAPKIGNMSPPPPKKTVNWSKKRQICQSKDAASMSAQRSGNYVSQKKKTELNQ